MCYFGGDFGWGVVLVDSRRFLDSEATLWCRNPLLSSYKFTKGLKIEWLVANVSAVRSPDRSEGAIMEVILVGRCFGQFRQYLWSGSHFVV